MTKPISERERVITHIKDEFSNRFNVLTNIEKEENYIANIFPDLIFLDKESNQPVFILEVKKNGRIASCMQQWKNVSSIPATLYIIVPDDELANAKSIAEVVGLNNRFGSYKIDEQTNEIVVTYD